MSRNNPATPIWRVAVRVIAAALLVGFSPRTPVAQQPAAGGGGPAHAAAPHEGRRGNEADIQIGLSSRRPTKQDTNIAAPHFVQMAPAKDRPVLPPGSNIIDRNAIGIPVLRRDLAPAAPLVGHVAVHPLAPQSAGVGLPVGSVEISPLRMTGAPPLASSRGAITGASFTRPGTALVPLGGPAKQAATGINGTNIKPKH